MYISPSVQVIEDDFDPKPEDRFMVWAKTHANVLLTGQAGLDAVGRAVNDAGLYRYISKPWRPDDLTMTVREAVRAWLAV